MLTTNHRDSLDAAMIRPGRIDLALEIGLNGAPQVRALFRAFTRKRLRPGDELAAALGERRCRQPRCSRCCWRNTGAREASLENFGAGSVACRMPVDFAPFAWPSFPRRRESRPIASGSARAYGGACRSGSRRRGGRQRLHIGS